MSKEKKPEIGTIQWADLTVREAERVRNFYLKVVGWEFEPVKMGSYDDYSMKTPKEGTVVAGVCHSRGVNADIPPQWLIYITVADVEKSANECVNLGGKIVVEPRSLGASGRFCIIQDPAGAVAALFEPNK